MGDLEHSLGSHYVCPLGGVFTTSVERINVSSDSEHRYIQNSFVCPHRDHSLCGMACLFGRKDSLIHTLVNTFCHAETPSFPIDISHNSRIRAEREWSADIRR